MNEWIKDNLADERGNNNIIITSKRRCMISDIEFELVIIDWTIVLSTHGSYRHAASRINDFWFLFPTQPNFAPFQHPMSKENVVLSNKTQSIDITNTR